jgi:hypothetical protein
MPDYYIALIMEEPVKSQTFPRKNLEMNHRFQEEIFLLIIGHISLRELSLP